jgi:hypothetical protein
VPDLSDIATINLLLIRSYKSQENRLLSAQVHHTQSPLSNRISISINPNAMGHLHVMDHLRHVVGPFLADETFSLLLGADVWMSVGDVAPEFSVGVKWNAAPVANRHDDGVGRV